MSFEEIVMSCYENKEFVNQYNRLTNSEIKSKKEPILSIIDSSTGKTSDELKKFIEFVEEYVYQPALLSTQRNVI